VQYSIGEIAKLLNIAPSTLRYYDKKGLLPFVERSASGVRVFTESDYEWLKTIECLKKTGMSLEDIKGYIALTAQGDSTLQERLEIMQKQRVKVEKQIEEAQQMLVTLDYKCWYYQMAETLGSAKAVKELKDEELPEEYRAVRARLRLKNADEQNAKSNQGKEK